MPVGKRTMRGFVRGIDTGGTSTVVIRQLCCPACCGLIENEVCRAGDPLLQDIRLAMEEPAR